LIEGRLQLDSWDDKQSGQKRSKLKVIGETMQLLGGKPGAGGESGEETPRSTGRTTPPPPRSSPSEPDDDEIPF
ncbi:MAG: single-stranded DNA-binding protein, partial [Verrucomicrobiota bacterium]|nr:single-stranded DNA-binding protein [Verrucomicrobiota bacterium]